MTDTTSNNRPAVHGLELDAQTRCAHYRSALDVIAIRMKCCGLYYACKDCHDALETHERKVWPRAEWDTKAVLCGVCGSELSICAYMDGANTCASCGAGFNPGCATHYHFYFGTD